MKTFIYPEILYRNEKVPPVGVIQYDVENNLPVLLGKRPEEIKNIVIVGAWRGDEVSSFLKFPRAVIFCFEPDEPSFNYLQRRFSGNNRVKCFPFACGPENGVKVFYQTNLLGNGSLLKPLPNTILRVEAEKKIEVRRLDGLNELKNLNIDLLWADVQGYELEVLKGAEGLLKNCSALFLEVEEAKYDQATSYTSLQDYLKGQGFVLAADGKGNAMFLPASRNFENIFDGVLDRVRKGVRKEHFRKKISGFGPWRHLPENFKLAIKKIIKW